MIHHGIIGVSCVVKEYTIPYVHWLVNLLDIRPPSRNGVHSLWCCLLSPAPSRVFQPPLAPCLRPAFRSPCHLAPSPVILRKPHPSPMSCRVYDQLERRLYADRV